MPGGRRRRRHSRRGGKLLCPDGSEPTESVEQGQADQGQADQGQADQGEQGEAAEEGKEEAPKAGRRHSRRHRHKTMRVPKGLHVKAKTLKRMLKAKGLKTSGKKSTLRARAREAHLIGGR